MCRTLPGHSTRKHCHILPFLSLRFIQFSDNDCTICVLSAWRVKNNICCFAFDKFDCKFAYRLFGSDGTTKIFTFLYANLRWYIHLSFIFVAVESQYSMLLGWMILSSILTTKCYYYYYPESQTNKRFMKKQHIHVGMRAPITNKQVRGQPPQSFKAKRLKRCRSQILKNGPYSKFLTLSSENFGDMISCDILRNLCWSSGLVSENPDDIPRVCGWYRDKFLLKFWSVHSDDIFRQVR